MSFCQSVSLSGSRTVSLSVGQSVKLRAIGCLAASLSFRQSVSRPLLLLLLPVCQAGLAVRTPVNLSVIWVRCSRCAQLTCQSVSLSSLSVSRGSPQMWLSVCQSVILRARVCVPPIDRIGGVVCAVVELCMYSCARAGMIAYSV